MPLASQTRPTQRDIAQLAGVSITTVSHVVNGTRPVAADTTAAVLAAIEQTGYTGDAIARSLVTGGTKSLGVALPLAKTAATSALIQAIEQEAAAAGYTVLLSDTCDSLETEQIKIRTLRSHRVDGLLLSAAHHGEKIDEILASGTPVVLMDNITMRTDVDQVGTENIQATSALTGHLAEVGHHRIGLIGADTGSSTSEERTLGYRLGLGRAGLSWDSGLIANEALTRDGGAAALRQLLHQPEPPTALVITDGVMAAGVVREAQRQNLRIGSNLAMVGFGEVDWAELISSPLTTMDPPNVEIGRVAVRLLLSRLSDPDRQPKTIRLPPSLNHRASCGCAT